MDRNDYQKYIYMKIHDGTELIYVRDDEHGNIILDLLSKLEDAKRECDKWRATCLQEAKKHGEAEADAARLAAEYERTLKEIGGVWWEDPNEKSPALISHKQRLENSK